MSGATRHRLREVVALLRTHPEGLTTPEIAEQLGVTRQTAYKDIQRLSLDGIPIYDEGKRYFLDASYQTELVLSLVQAWLLYLPLRRIVRADLHRIPVVHSLLHQIASLLHGEMADHLTPLPESHEEEIDTVLKTLVQCWHEGRLAEIRYRRPNASRETVLAVQPWWFEPAIWSDAFYVIGGFVRSDGPVEPLTLKLERIQSVRVKGERFERPPIGELLEAIEKTWGIWMGEDEPVTVRLRFHNRQLDRLRETRWHPTQRLSLEPDGSVIWEAEISEPQEMLPWIRGWGEDVEVLEPEHIRQRLAAGAEAVARLYGRMSGEEPRFF